MGAALSASSSEEMFPGRRVFNAFLAGPSIEDLAAPTHVLSEASLSAGVDRRRGRSVVGSERGAPGSAMGRWADDYLAFDDANALRTSATKADPVWSRIQDDLGFTTTRASLELFRRTRRGSVTALIADDPESLRQFCTHSALDATSGRPTGMLWAARYRYLDPADRRHVAEAYVQSNPHAMASAELLTSRGFMTSRASRRRGSPPAATLLLAPPFNPTTYQTRLAHPRIGPNLHDLDSVIGPPHPWCPAPEPTRRGIRPNCSVDEFLDSHARGCCPASGK